MTSNTKTIIKYAILLELCFLALYLVEPLRQLFGDNELTLKNNFVFFIVRAVMLLALVFYAMAINRIKEFKTPAIKGILIAAAIFNLTLIFAWPIKSSDLFTYIYRARVISVHHENPYITPYNHFPHDAFYDRINNLWSGNTNIYGPVFTYMSTALSYLSGDNLWLNIALFKLLMTLASLGSAYMIYRISKNQMAALIFAWNPYLIFEFAVDAHNDILQIFFITIGLYYLFKSKTMNGHLIAWSMMMLSFLIKFFSVLFLPFVFFYSLFSLPKEKRLSYFLSAALLSIALIVLLYLPIWEGFGIFSRLQALVVKTDSLWLSPGIWFLTVVLQGIELNDFFFWSIAVNRALFVVLSALTFFLSLHHQNLRDKNKLLIYMALVFGFFIFFFLTWLFPWYMSTLFALFALNYGISENKYALYATLALTLYIVMTYFPFNEVSI